jgi:hypothetical protein
MRLYQHHNHYRSLSSHVPAKKIKEFRNESLNVKYYNIDTFFNFSSIYGVVIGVLAFITQLLEYSFGYRLMQNDGC